MDGKEVALSQGMADKIIVELDGIEMHPLELEDGEKGRVTG
ncbi:hypothetical protein [Desulfovulcanus sp.]